VVEREFGRLNHEWALAPLRVRGLDRVRLHADLTIRAKLASALARGASRPASRLAPCATYCGGATQRPSPLRPYAAASPRAARPWKA